MRTRNTWLRLFLLPAPALLVASAHAQYAPKDGPLESAPAHTPDAAASMLRGSPFASGGTLSALAGTESTLRVSVDSGGRQGDGHSFVTALSSDGRFVAFSSVAAKLVPGDTNGAADIFVHDRDTGVTERVSVSSTGLQGNADSLGPAISADGRFVAFRSLASTLVAGDTNLSYDIFRRDRATGVTVRVNVSSTGAQAINASSSSYAGISADGRYVVFESNAANLVANDTNGSYDVFLHDVPTGGTAILSISSTGTIGNGNSFEPSISADGLHIAFSSFATNLVTPNVGFPAGIFVRDLSSRTTALVARSTSIGDSRRPSISDDGRWIAFESEADSLIVGDTNAVTDVLLADRSAHTIVRVSVDSNGAQANGASGIAYSTRMLSGDGRSVIFESTAANLVAGDSNGTMDVFVHDAASGTTSRASVDSARQEGSGVSARPAISGDGHVLAFESGSDDLVGGDVNESYDVFARLSIPGAAPITTYCSAKINSLGCLPAISSSSVPSLAGSDAFFLSATDVVNRKPGIFVWSLAPASVPFKGGTRCVQWPFVRTPIQDSGGSMFGTDCSGTQSFHFSHAYMNSRGLSAGTTVYGQFFTRDLGFPIPLDFGLTDAVQFTIAL